MRKEENLKKMIECGVVPVLRVKSSDEAVKIADVMVDSGINNIEVSLVTPDAIEAISEISKNYEDKIITGAGTVLDSESTRTAILAGADYIVSPTINDGMIKTCKRYNKICIPGAFTPTEILKAWELGADLVKVFPARLGSAQYFKDVLAPLPQVRLMAAGGVNLENAGEFIKAGASVVAVGSSLIDKKAVAERKWEIIKENARKILKAVSEARKAKN